MKSIFRFLSSLSLTVVLLGLSIVLVFFGTLDQVQWGINHTQKLYFESWVVMSPVFSLMQLLTSQMQEPTPTQILIPLPGGFTLGTLLLVNLLCAHLRYFKASWKKCGIAILHLGVLLLLVSGFLTSMLQEESQMTLDEGGAPVRYSIDIRATELVLIDKSGADTDEVTAVPFQLALKNDELALPNGFKLKIHAAMPNAGMGLRNTVLADYEREATRGSNGGPPLTERQFRQVSNTITSLRDSNVIALNLDGTPRLSTEGLEMKGFAPMMDGVVVEQPMVFKMDEANVPAAAVEVIAPNGDSLGTWLLSAGIGPNFPPQGFEYEGRRYDLGLRSERTYFPFTLQLRDFKHDRYPGTTIPKNFSSDVVIDNPETGENRPVLIYMNNPLRYGGFTFFQASFANDDTTSILQVVRNPSWLLPYVAVALVGVGMIVQFYMSLMRFLNRSNTSRQPKAIVNSAALPPAKPLAANGPSGPSGGIIVPIIALVIGLIVISYGFFQRSDSKFAIEQFAELPVQSGGRILPIDSVARNSLRIIRGRANVRLEDQKMTAAEWLLDLAYKPEQADEYPVFRIDHPEVLGLFGWEQTDKKYFSWNELSPHFQLLMQTTEGIPQEEVLRSGFQKAVVKLTSALSLYNGLGHSLSPGTDFQLWPEIAGPGGEALLAKERGEEFDMNALEPFVFLSRYYMQLSNTATLGIAYPPPGSDSNDWLNVGQGMLQTITTDRLNEVITGYGEIGNAYRDDEPEAFAKAVTSIQANVANHVNSGKVRFEEFFNKLQPFIGTMILYVIILILAGASWLKWPATLQRAAFWLLILAFIVHTYGLLARMYIQGRPPVTNLYSSAIFSGWAAIIIGIVIERLYRNGMGSFVAALIGFCTLIIAQNLALTGDTMEMMQAVLDSNFWLATHVVIITAGYGAVFLAGALGLVYIVLGLMTKGLDRKSAKTLYGMAYGVTCFGLLFSFVGTMLGGIWADQSWGRFWGWDPKENGALIIVLWGALMLHARWGGLVRERGFMALAVFGNIVTAWSWFGTNLLGIGLHAYGFMSAVFFWLTVFWISQVFFIGISLIPLKWWRSFPLWKRELTQ